MPVWGDVELAWRLRPAGQPWLGVTGTNGKTTTVLMLAAILGAAGHRAVAAGNVGLPLLDAVLADPPYDVLAVELSSFQLHWTSTVALHAGARAQPRAGPPRLARRRWTQYAAAKAQDLARRRGARRQRRRPGWSSSSRRRSADGRTVGFTLGDPAPGQLGVARHRRGRPCCGPRARVGPAGRGVELADVADVQPPAPHNVANALAAAALARSLRPRRPAAVPAAAVRAGLRAVDPGAHRIAHVATVDGVDVRRRLQGDQPARRGGLAAGVPARRLGRRRAGQGRRSSTSSSRGPSTGCAAAVLMGRDRAVVAEALARHAPEVPVVEVAGTDTGAMDDVVRAAAALARPGDTVLLAPACASMDMFRDYAERGDAFAAAVRRLPGARPAS